MAPRHEGQPSQPDDETLMGADRNEEEFQDDEEEEFEDADDTTGEERDDTA